MKLLFLGSGSISSLSNHSAILIDDNILIDCGNGIYKALLRNKIDITKIKFILITHLHIDHIFDIPLLLYGIRHKNPSQNIIFIGNKLLKKTILSLMRIGFPNSYNEILKNLDIIYIRNDNLKSFQLTHNYNLKSFKVIHGKVKDCFGYVFNNIIALTGDTSYCESVKMISKDIKYLIVDSTMRKGNYSHMGVDNIKELSINNKNLKIIATHMSINSKKLIEKTIFVNNNVLIASDGKTFNIKID